jgi:hypothetical protein
VRINLLAPIAALNWNTAVRASITRRLLVEASRGLLLMILLAARWGRLVLAWTGWVIALIVWMRARRAAAAHKREQF